jgi:hypothetical protein
LPSIRKHGIYATDNFLQLVDENPLYLAQVFTRIHEERDARKIAEAKLQEKTLQLDEAMDYFSVKRVAKLNGINWREIDWKLLKNTSKYMELPVKRIFDANYGTVNAYHIDVWRTEYAHLVPRNNRSNEYA